MFLDIENFRFRNYEEIPELKILLIKSLRIYKYILRYYGGSAYLRLLRTAPNVVVNSLLSPFVAPYTIRLGFIPNCI